MATATSTGPAKTPTGPNAAEAAEDGEDQRNDRRVDPVFRKKGRSRLSTPATTSAHQMARPMQATVDPVSHSQMHTGSQTRAVPTKGMGATNAQ